MSSAAIVLLSGGLDSTVALHLVKHDFEILHTLSFSYGQRHSKELDLAQWQSKAAGAQSHRIVDLSFTSWGGSALTDPKLEVPQGEYTHQQSPITYVPARNMVFLSVAASIAETLRAEAIVIGVSEVDYSGYVDCREEFLQSMERTINLGTERRAMGGQPIRIIAPFLRKSKADEVRLGLSLGVDFSHTWSCYKGEDRPCGRCDSCLLRAQAFSQAGANDPLVN